MKQLSCGTRALTVKLRQHTNTDVHTDTLKRVRNVLRGKKKCKRETNKQTVIWEKRGRGMKNAILFFTSHWSEREGQNKSSKRNISPGSLTPARSWTRYIGNSVRRNRGLVTSGKSNIRFTTNKKMVQFWCNSPGWEGLGSGNRKLPVKKRIPPPGPRHWSISIKRNPWLEMTNIYRRRGEWDGGFLICWNASWRPEQRAHRWLVWDGCGRLWLAEEGYGLA